VIFAVDAEWDCGSTVASEVLADFNRAFRPADDGVCAWADGQSRATLRAEFDVDAVDFEEAISRAVADVQAAARVSDLPGTLVSLIAMTEEGQATWTP
jgi:hypothetical protein